MSMIPLVGTLVDKVVDTVAGDSPIGDLVKGGVKIGTAIFTGDLISGIEGAKNCIDAVSKAPQQTVEFLGNAAAFAICPLGWTAKMVVDKLTQGYAGSWQQQFGNSVDALRKHFDLLDTAHGLGGRDGVIGRCDLESALQNPRIPCELRQACKFLLQNPAAFNQLSANHGAVDGFIKREDLMCPTPPPPGSCAPPSWPPPPTCAPPYAPPPAFGMPVDPGCGAPPPATGGGGTDPLRAAWDQMFDQAIKVLGQRFDLLDTAFGLGSRDGVIGRCDLQAALQNPSIPTDLRDVCRFLLMNPAAFHQLSANKGEVDGFIKKDDLPAAKSSGSSKSSSSSGTSKSSASSKAKDDDDDTSTKSTSSSKAKSTSKFSGLSAEEIVEAMMQDMLDGMDEELVDAANELEQAETTHKSTAKGSEDEKKSSIDVNRAQAKMQKVMERRRQMFELLSNFSRIGHEMAKAAIGNLGRV